MGRETVQAYAKHIYYLCFHAEIYQGAHNYSNKMFFHHFTVNISSTLHYIQLNLAMIAR